MKVTRNKVDYTEVEVSLSVEETRALIAEHIRANKNVEVSPENVVFDIKDYDPVTGEEGVLLGVTAKVIKRGRVQKKAERNGEAKIKPEAVVYDAPEAEAVKPAKKAKKSAEVAAEDAKPAKKAKKAKKPVEDEPYED